jgi:hypothetical protein
MSIKLLHLYPFPRDRKWRHLSTHKLSVIIVPKEVCWPCSHWGYENLCSLLEEPELDTRSLPRFFFFKSLFWDSPQWSHCPGSFRSCPGCLTDQGHPFIGKRLTSTMVRNMNLWKVHGEAQSLNSVQYELMHSQYTADRGLKVKMTCFMYRILLLPGSSTGKQSHFQGNQESLSLTCSALVTQHLSPCIGFSVQNIWGTGVLLRQLIFP